ncbi:DUF2913 family protein [uncultured Vibrio sp.]|uniref:DUF2913 family protein n=1 Tax=uncultured Vibrio sp. TaxID=114054 RepID=UPI0025D4F280|nr:DUF2913 family protein [uncultured Vibrio sp.]
MHPTQLLLDLCTHALLHLEFKKLVRRLNTNEKNQLLVQYIKPFVKSVRHRAIRKSTKQWLLAGRRANNDFEAMLEKEHARLLDACSSDLFQFVNLISQIESQLKTKVQYSLAKDIDLEARFGKVLICVVDESLNASFDEDGHMTHSTQLLFVGDTSLKNRFSEIVEINDHFQTIVAYEDESHLRIEMLRL